jgi:hypothetical protein
MARASAMPAGLDNKKKKKMSQVSALGQLLYCTM